MTREHKDENEELGLTINVGKNKILNVLVKR
jgi:hypothetical protein